MAAALARAGRRPGAWGRPPIDGLPELREWFAREHRRHAVTAAEVLITAGGQSALTTALRALAPPGAPVLVESPTYPGMLAIARAAGLRPGAGAGGRRRGAARTARRRLPGHRRPGLRLPAALPEPDRRGARRRARAARCCASPARRAPSSSRTTSPAASSTRTPGRCPRPLAADDPDGVVVHVCSLTKATSPSLRVGALAARGPVLERLRAIQVVDSFFVPRPLQEAALELVGSPAWPRHLRAVAGRVEEPPGHHDRRAAAATCPNSPCPHIPSGGYHLWLRLPDGTDEAALRRRRPARGRRRRPRPPLLLRRTPGRPPAAELRRRRGRGGDRGGGTAAAGGLRRGARPRAVRPATPSPAMTATSRRHDLDPPLPERLRDLRRPRPHRRRPGPPLAVHRRLLGPRPHPEKQDRAIAGSLNFGAYDGGFGGAGRVRAGGHRPRHLRLALRRVRRPVGARQGARHRAGRGRARPPARRTGCGASCSPRTTPTASTRRSGSSRSRSRTSGWRSCSNEGAGAATSTRGERRIRRVTPE